MDELSSGTAGCLVLLASQLLASHARTEARAVVRSAGLSVASASLQSRSPPPLLPTTAPTKAAKQTAGHILGTPNRQFEVKADPTVCYLLICVKHNSAFFLSILIRSKSCVEPAGDEQARR